jgi:hypothetical protein
MGFSVFLKKKPLAPGKKEIHMKIKIENVSIQFPQKYLTVNTPEELYL